MGRYLLFPLLLLLLHTSPAQGQETEAKTEEGPVWTLQVDPLTTLLGIVHVLVETRVSSHIAVYAGPSLKLFDTPLKDEELSYRAYGAEMGARWFFSGTAPTGWWVGGRLTVAHVTHQDQSRVGGYVSALGGYAWHFGGRWLLSGALGVSYFEYSAGGVGVEGVNPGAHTAFGVTF